ncbi:MAG: fibronectin type III domain-containing protein [Oceanipulchritudo sp.]
MKENPLKSVFETRGKIGQRALAALAISLMAAASARADGLIAYEGFEGYPLNYPDGTAPAKEGSPFVNWEPQNPFLMKVIAEAGLEYSRLPVTDGYLNLSSGGTKMVVDLDMSADGPFADYLTDAGQVGKDGTTLYVSFLYQIANPPAGQGYFQFYNRASETELFNGTKFGVGHGWGSSTPVQFKSRGPILHAHDGATHFVVIRMDYQDGNDTIRVWLDPPLTAREEQVAPVDGAFSQNATFDAFYFVGQGRDADGTTYYFDELRFADNWSAALGGIPDLPPGPPANPQARAVSGSEIVLEWVDNNLNESGYIIRRSASADGPWEQLTVTAENASSHTDSGLLPEMDYYYQILATNANGDSEPAGPLFATTFPEGQSLPLPPADLAVSLLNNRPSLSWTDAATDEYGYRIYRALDDGLFQLIAEIDNDSEAFTDNNAPVEALLRYRIVSVNELGESLVTATLEAGPIPEPDSGLNWVWIEGENYTSSTFPTSGTWLEPSNALEMAACSKGDLFGRLFTDEDLLSDIDYMQTYTFTPPADGVYSLYFRNLSTYGPFLWKVDDGDWLAANTEVLPELQRSDYRTSFSLTWQKAEDTVELTGGQAYTLTVKVNLLNDFPDANPRWKKHYAWDAFLFTTVPFAPSGKAKPGVKFALQDNGFWAFEPDTDAYAAVSPIDLSHLNEDVAGQDGWVQRSGSEYFLGSGEKVRFAGVGIKGGTYSSYREQARFLAKRGVNAVRWHSNIDDRSPDSDSILNVNEAALAEAQQAVAAMKEEGIYVNISCFFPLFFRVREQWNIPGFDAAYIAEKDRAPYGLFIWNDLFTDAYKHWISELLTRPNPWEPNQTPIGQDPAVMNFEIINEDNLFWFSFNPSEYPDAQRHLLEQKFGDWVVAEYGSIEAAYSAWGGGERTGDSVEAGRLEVESPAALRGGTTARRLRQQDQLRFMTETQAAFWAEIRDFVRGLGYQGPVSATNWKTANDGLLRDVENFTYTQTDVLDVHNYFNSPSVTELSYAISVGDVYRSLSAVDQPEELSSAVKQIEDRVSMVSEFIWVNPNDVAAEAPLVTSAHAAMQDLDALFWFHYGSIGFDTVYEKWQVGRPSVMGQFPGANLLYRRGDFAEAPVAVREGRSYDSLMAMEEAIIIQNSGFDPTRDTIYDPEQGTGSLGMEASLVGKVEVAFGDSDVDFVHPDLPALQDETNGSIRSLTGELELDQERGIFLLDSPRSQGVTSYTGDAGPVELSDTVIELRNIFGAVLVISLDGLPIADSEKVLIQAGTIDQPFGFSTKAATLAGEEALEVANLGAIPFNVQYIDGQVRLRGFSGATAQYLDLNGYPVAAPVHFDEGDDLVVQLPFNALYTVVTRESGTTPPPAIFTREARSPIEGLPYSARLDGFSKAGPLTWSLVDGALPDGLSLADDGSLSGTTTETGVHSFTVAASDGTAATQATVSIRVIDITPEQPGGLVLTPGEWIQDPDLGLTYGHTENWGYALNLGFLYTGYAPWLYQVPFGWIYLHSADEEYDHFYHTEKGWLLRQHNSPKFQYWTGSAWAWNNFLIPQD